MAADMEQEPAASDLKTLVNDLLGVVMLPAVWHGTQPQQVAQSLVDVLARLLRPDLLHVRVEAAQPVRAEWSRQSGGESPGALLEAQLGSDPGGWPASARIDFAGRQLNAVLLRLGWQGDGVLVVASHRAGFPTAAERLLLGVTANQAAVGLQEARLLSVQRNLAEELDRRVAQRTAELAAANTELERSKALLAQAQRLSATGSFTWRPHDDAVTLSDEGLCIFRFVPGTSLTMASLETRVHPDDAAAFRQRFASAGSTGAALEFDTRLQLPGGGLRYLHLLARSSEHSAGCLEYTGAVQDVTERRQAEQALAKASSELSHVARITTLGVLAASIAHEVNQPLAGVITNANTVLRALGGDPPDPARATLAAQRLLRDGSRAADVVRRLRALFGKRAALAELVDLNDAAREVLAVMALDLQRDGITVQAELADSLPAVRGDRVQLQQVLLNFVRNAADAMKTVADRPRLLLLRTELPGDGTVRVLVRDTGEGFRDADPSRLFDAFYTTKAEGMGIGLSVSRSILDHHEGRIGAGANAGPGATFWFAVPLSVQVETTRADQACAK